MAAKKFMALENGTLSNPYRFVQKGKEVELTDEEAELYADSSWLVPLKKAKAIAENPPPLMSHMNETDFHKKSTAMDAIAQLPVEPNYQAQMDTIIAGEKAADAKANETKTEGETGTGNKSVI